jgi:hypothetical protein
MRQAASLKDFSKYTHYKERWTWTLLSPKLIMKQSISVYGSGYKFEILMVKIEGIELTNLNRGEKR